MSDSFCNPMEGSPPGSSVRGISQARILEWVAVSFLKNSQALYSFVCLGIKFFFFFLSGDEKGAIIQMKLAKVIRGYLQKGQRADETIH